MDQEMFARVRTGYDGGRVLSRHRSWTSAHLKSGRKAFEVVLTVPATTKVGDVLLDWKKLEQAQKAKRLRAQKQREIRGGVCDKCGAPTWDGACPRGHEQKGG